MDFGFEFRRAENVQKCPHLGFPMGFWRRTFSDPFYSYLPPLSGDLVN
jgi:hypothetical protein